jgi:phosphatidylglycerol:prolipoprotein diacylglycerol transferase
LFPVSKRIIMDLAIITWNVNPEIFRIGNFAPRWYGVLFASGFLFGYLIFKKIFKNEGLKNEMLDKLTIYMAIGVIVGARLGHCLFYEPSYYLSHPIEILKIWRGGLASHGAAIAVPLVLWFWARKEKKPFIWILDRIVIVVALGGAMIRLGNLMNSEIYGVETTLPWGFVFLRNGETVPKHPTQIYESLVCFITFIILYRIYWRKKGQFIDGLPFSLFLIIIFVFRFFVEFVKEDQVAFEANMTLNMGQWLSVPFILIGVLVLVFSLRRHRMKAG